MIVKDDVRYSFNNYNSIYLENPFSVLRNNMGGLEDVFVTEETLLKMLKDTKKIDKSVNSLLDDTVKDTVLVESIYIYVNELENVDKVAEILTNAGYDITYTLKSFHSLSSSLQKIMLFLVVLVGVLLLSSVINIVLSFLSYIKIQQRDMGILKFHGFSPERIYKMYKSNFCFVFGFMFAVICIFVAFGGIVVLNVTNYPIIMMLCIVVGIFIFILQSVILRFGLRKVLNNNIMYLMKASKEFE